MARLSAESESSQYQDVLYPAPLLARLAKVALPEDLPLLKRQMERFGSSASVEAHYVVEAALRVPGWPAAEVLAAWYNRYVGLRAHIAFGLARRPGYPHAWVERLAAAGDARTQIMVKTLLHAPDAQPTVLRYLVEGSPEEKFQASSLAAFTSPAGLDKPLRTLLTFHDARYYPGDALLRHAAMESLLRLALIASRPDRPRLGHRPSNQRLVPREAQDRIGLARREQLVDAFDAQAGHVARGRHFGDRGGLAYPGARELDRRARARCRGAGRGRPHNASARR